MLMVLRSKDDLEPRVERVLFRERFGHVPNLHRVGEVGVFPVELRADPLVQIPIEARGCLKGLIARLIDGAGGAGKLYR